MPSSSKAKGNRFERELVADCAERGLTAERAWGSDGRAIGEKEGVDIRVEGIRVQAKRKKQLPKWLQVPEGADVVVFREDRGSSWAMLPWDDFLELLMLHRWYQLEKGDADE